MSDIGDTSTGTDTDLSDITFIPPISAGWTPPGEALRTVCNPDNPQQTYTLWTNGFVKAGGKAPDITAANPPIIVDTAKGEKAMDIAIMGWGPGTPSGYILTNWARVWPFGGAKVNAPEMLTARKNIGAVAFAMDPMGNGSGYWLVNGGAVRGFGTAPALPANDLWVPAMTSWGKILFKKLAKGAYVRDWVFDWDTKRFILMYTDGTMMQSTNARSSSVTSAAKAYLGSTQIARSLAYNFAGNEGYLLDQHGGVFTVGKAKSLGPANPYWANRNVARDIVFQSWGAKDARRYWILDYRGGLHDRIKSEPPTVRITSPTGITEVQRITFPVPATGGSFRVQRVGLSGTVTSKTSAPIPWNASEVTIRNTLWAMFGDFDTGVVLGPGRSITVTFGGPNQEGEQPLLRIVNSSIVPTAATPTVAEITSGASPIINSTTTPKISWSYQDVEADMQGTYEVQIWAKPTNGWPTAWRQQPPATTTAQKPYWSIKGTGSSTREVEVAKPLVDGEYRIYLRVTEFRGVAARWANLTIVVDLIRPRLPAVSLAPNADDACVDMTVTEDTTGSTDLIAWERSLDGKTWTPVRSSGSKVNGAVFTDTFDRPDANTLGANWVNQGYPMTIREEFAEAGLSTLVEEDTVFSRLFLFGDSGMNGANQPIPLATYSPTSLADALRDVVPRTLGISETFPDDTPLTSLLSGGNYVIEDFDRPKGVTTFGYTDTGDRWASNGSTWQVTGGSARLLKKVTGQRPAVTIDAGSPDIMVTSRFDAIGAGDTGGVIVRNTASNSRSGICLFWDATSGGFWTLSKILPGSETSVPITVPGDWTWSGAGGDIYFGLAAVGNSLWFLVNGAVRGSPVTITDPALWTGTRVGLATGISRVGTSVRFGMFEVAKFTSSPPMENPPTVNSGNWRIVGGSATLTFEDAWTQRSVLGTDANTPDGTVEVSVRQNGTNNTAGAGPAARIGDVTNYVAAVRCSLTGPDYISSAPADRWGLAFSASAVDYNTTIVLPADAATTLGTKPDRVALQLQGRYARIMVRNRWINFTPRYAVPNAVPVTGTANWTATNATLSNPGSAIRSSSTAAGTITVTNTGTITVRPGETVAFAMLLKRTTGTTPDRFAQMFITGYDAGGAVTFTTRGRRQVITSTGGTGGTNRLEVSAHTTDLTTRVQVGYYIFGATAAAETYDHTTFVPISVSLYRLPVAYYEAMLGFSSVGVVQVRGQGKAVWFDSFRFDEVFSYSGNDTGPEEPLDLTVPSTVREGLTAPNVMGEGSVYDVRFAPMLHGDDTAVLYWGVEDLLPAVAITSPGTVTFPNRSLVYAEATRVILSSVRTTSRTAANDASITYGGTWETDTGAPAYSATAPLRDLVTWQWAGAGGTGAWYRVTNTASATATISVPATFDGSPIAIGVIDTYTGGPTNAVTISVDGGIPKTFSLGGVAEAADGRRSIPRVFRLTDVAPGAHTVVVTHVGTTAPLALDYWAIEGSSPRIAVASLRPPSGVEVEAPDITTSTTIGRSDQEWLDNAYNGKTVVITTGTGAGQVRTISSNTATTLTVATAWTTTPNSSSTFRIAEPNKDWTYVGADVVAVANAVVFTAVSEFPHASMYDPGVLGDDVANYTNSTEPSPAGAHVLAGEASESLTSTDLDDYEAVAVTERPTLRAVSAEISAGASLFLGVDSVDVPTLGAKVTNTGKGITLYQPAGGDWAPYGTWQTPNLFPLISHGFDEDASGFRQIFGAPTATGGADSTGIEAGDRSLKAVPIGGTTTARFALGLGAAGSAAVNPGDTVTVRMFLRRSSVQPISARASMAWSFFSVVDADVDGALTPLTTDWAEYTWTFTVPASRYGGNLLVKFSDPTPATLRATAYIEIDKISVFTDGSTEWKPSLGDFGSGLVRVVLNGSGNDLLVSAGGLPAFGVLTETYGPTHGFGATVPGARINDFNIGRTLNVTLKDYEATPGVPYSYRAYALSANKEIRSLPTLIGSVIPPVRGFWLKDPLRPASNLRIFFEEDDLITSRAEEQGVFTPGGRATAVVVTGLVRANTIAGMNISVTSDAQRDKVLAILDSQHTLLFQTPTGKQWYMRVGSEIAVTDIMGADWKNPQRIYQINIPDAVEVDVP